MAQLDAAQALMFHQELRRSFLVELYELGVEVGGRCAKYAPTQRR